ncbi:helix-turn-helix domain-containing protein [Proteus mirabilis]|uniref:helix-turn-helix domain-containing protein n=1 Tax=Proteus mirabilis TaxID=584 RepID=UPI001B394A54|nr:helix-turn-helix transcriptional regulator [Proteus mirabilis]MBQ0623169.1 helix-turn-helix transcriptional regulator [Proteus mirabilis]
MNNINLIVANRIKQSRKKLRITGTEMSRELGISQQHYSRIENGNIKITVELLFSIAFILNMTPQSLLPNYNLLDKKIINLSDEKNIIKAKQALSAEFIIPIKEK